MAYVESITAKNETRMIRDLNGQQMLATVQESTTASKAYAVGDYLILNDKLYKVTTAIASGGTITVGTNVEEAKVGTELTDLNRQLSELNYDVTEIKNQVFPDIPTEIACWGDSLTLGLNNGADSYPVDLKALLGDRFDVSNYGHYGETAESVAFRQGAIIAMAEPFTSATAYVKIASLVTTGGASLASLSNNGAGSYFGDNIVVIDGNRYFYRRVSPTECQVARISGVSNQTFTRPISVNAIGEGVDKLILIAVGQNGWADTNPATLADIIEQMIKHNGNNYFLVLGIPTGDETSMGNLEKILGDRFGSKFVNTRKYISQYGLTDNNITPTADDTTAMETGAIPPSLRTDEVHLNTYGYKSLAKCVYYAGVFNKFWDSIYIINHPESVTLAAGTTHTFSVNVYGDGMSYLWMYKYPNSNTWQSFGAPQNTESSITRSIPATWNGLQIACQITNADGYSTMSKSAFITIS